MEKKWRKELPVLLLFVAQIYLPIKRTFSSSEEETFTFSDEEIAHDCRSEQLRRSLETHSAEMEIFQIIFLIKILRLRTRALSSSHSIFRKCKVQVDLQHINLHSTKCDIENTSWKLIENNRLDQKEKKCNVTSTSMFVTVAWMTTDDIISETNMYYIVWLLSLCSLLPIKNNH